MPEMADRLKDALQRRIDACNAEGNAVQAKKWEAELRVMTSPAIASALDQVAFDPNTLSKLAIYAAQKVRRLAATYVGAGRPDPYTEAMLTNARGMQAQAKLLSGKLARASLSGTVKTEQALTVRRKASDGTASTQASSTRQALVALRAGKIVGRGAGAELDVDFAHPFVAKVIGA